MILKADAADIDQRGDELILDAARVVLPDRAGLAANDVAGHVGSLLRGGPLDGRREDSPAGMVRAECLSPITLVAATEIDLHGASLRVAYFRIPFNVSASLAYRRSVPFFECAAA
jgi:hypothetical protein